MSESGPTFHGQQKGQVLRSGNEDINQNKFHTSVQMDQMVLYKGLIDRSAILRTNDEGFR